MIERVNDVNIYRKKDSKLLLLVKFECNDNLVMPNVFNRLEKKIHLLDYTTQVVKYTHHIARIIKGSSELSLMQIL